MTMRQITLLVTGMTCANCAVTIERGLRNLHTVANANLNLASERASLEFDSSWITEAQITAAAARMGYALMVAPA